MKILNWSLTRFRPGDLVAKAAKPVAKGIDAATSVLPPSMHTDLEHCQGCARRQAGLNELFRK